MAKRGKAHTAVVDAPGSIPTHVGRRIAVLRTALDLTQSGLARETRVKRSSISEYEAGVTTPDASTLERLLGGMQFRWSALDLAGWFLGRLSGCTVPAAPGSPSAEADVLERMAAEMQEIAGRLTAMAQTIRNGGETAGPPLPSAEDQEAARALVASVRKLPVRTQDEKLRNAPQAIQWAICEALALESQRLCAEHPDRAIFLAKRAVSLADAVPGEETRRDKLRGLAWGHVGNALRAKEDFRAAEEAFASAERFTQAGAGSDLDLLVEEGLVPALKASLRRDQHRFAEAEELLASAALVARGARFKAQVAISRAKLHEEKNELEQAVALLEEMPDAEIPEDDGRLRLCVKHNLADNLSKLDRFHEANALLPEVRRLSRKVGGELDQVRLRWTEGRVVAGLGDVEGGTERLVKVRGEFASHDMGYDTALATLELAALYAREGKTAEVKTLARHMVPIFQSQGVHREALAALTLFRQAAEKEEVTMEFATEILVYLRKARYNPDLRFVRDVMKGV